MKKVNSSIHAMLAAFTAALMLAFSVIAQPSGNHGCNARFNSRTDTVAYAVRFMAAMYEPTATYAWDFGDGSNGSTWSTQHTYAAAGNYNVCLTVTRTDSTGDTLCSSTYCDHVNVTAPAPACDAHFTTYQNMHSGNVQFVSARNRSSASYAWDFGDGTSDSGAVANHAYSAAGTYYACLTVTRTDSVGTVICTASWCDSVHVATTTSGGNSAVCDAHFRNLTRTGSSTVTFFGGRASGGHASYSWDFGDGTTDSTKNLFHTYAATGSYYVCHTVTAYDSTGNVVCTDTWCDSVRVGTYHRPGGCNNVFGHAHHRLSGSVVEPYAGVFPNPVTEASVLHVEGFNAPAVFRVFNQSGQLVSEQTLNAEGDYDLDRSVLSSGIFFYQVVDGQHEVKGKFLVQ